MNFGSELPHGHSAGKGQIWVYNPDIWIHSIGWIQNIQMIYIMIKENFGILQEVVGKSLHSGFEPNIFSPCSGSHLLGDIGPGVCLLKS